MRVSLFKTTIAAGVLAIGGFIGQASAGVIGLALIVDGSGSISAGNWTLQMQGYHDAIEAVIPSDSSVAISGIQFGTGASTFQSMTVVNGGNKAAIADNFLTETQFGSGSTCISCGIKEAWDDFMASGLVLEKLIFDVSTDGAWNSGNDPDGDAGTEGSAEWAVANGVDVVNCLGVGGSADCSFIHGIDSFSVAAADFDAFEDALIEKIRRETGQDVSAPAGLALLGLGLLVVAFYRRRNPAAK